MNEYLQQQDVTADGRRKKQIRRLLIRLQSISLVVLVWLVMVGFIYGLYHLVFERGIFVVKDVEVEGELAHMSQDDVRNISGVVRGVNLFSVNLKTTRRQISKNPWVKEVAVARKLPSTIWIYVGEYSPIALFASDDLCMVDETGKVFKKAEGGEDKNLPVFTGLAAKEDTLNAVVLLKQYMNSPLSEYFAPAEINFDEARGNSIITLKDGVVLKLGTPEEVLEKLDRLYGMIGAIESDKRRIKYIDLNIPGKVVVKYES